MGPPGIGLAGATGNTGPMGPAGNTGSIGPSGTTGATVMTNIEPAAFSSSVMCPQGTKALGGGGDGEDATGLIRSVPIVAPDVPATNGQTALGWMVSTDAPGTMTAYAICAA